MKDETGRRHAVEFFFELQQDVKLGEQLTTGTLLRTFDGLLKKRFVEIDA